MAINQHQHIRFQAGQNIFIYCDAQSAGYTRFKIDRIEGSGAMYGDSGAFDGQYWDQSQEVWLPDGSMKWTNFIQETLNIWGQPNINQGTISLPSGITSISSNFLGELVFNLSGLPGGITSIGDRAFGGSRWIDKSQLDHQCNNRITSISIPASCTHIGRAAFAGANLLTNITINNDSYIMEEYTTSGNEPNHEQIFYVKTYEGINCDQNGDLITTVTANANILNFDWHNKFHRYIPHDPTFKVYVYSARAGRKIELPCYQGIGDVNLNVDETFGQWHFRLTDKDAEDASPVRIYVDGEVKAIAY